MGRYFLVKIIFFKEGEKTPSSEDPVYRIEQGGDESRQLLNILPIVIV